MTDWDALQSRVAAAYDAQRLPEWPNPRPDMAEPAHDEYSRVTDPDRYLVVQARSRSWRDALAELPGVRVESIDAGSSALGQVTQVGQRSVRVSSSVPCTLDLVLIEQDIRLTSGEGMLPVLRIAVSQPDVLLDVHPDCGCDACDSGSLDLLNAVDDAIRRVVEGPLVVLRGDGWGADWSPDRASSRGLGGGMFHRRLDHDAAIRICQHLAAGDDVRLPDRTETFVGQSWLSPPATRPFQNP